MMKILQSIDAFLFEIAFLVISIPRTFFRVIFTPRWINSYVQSELKKDAQCRYESYVAPMIFFVVVGVLPLTAGANYLLQQNENKFLAFLAKKFISASLEGKLTALSVFLTSFPMGFAAAIQRIKRQPLTRSLLQPVFYTQCMSFAAFYPLLFGSYYLLLRHIEMRRNTDEIGVFEWPPYLLFFDLAGILFIYNETRIITEELNTKWWKALVVISLGYFVSIVFMVLLESGLLLFIWVE
jgi:hypothetical protein